MSAQSWNPPTYWGAILAGEITPALPTVPVKHSFLARVRCGCGAEVWPQEMLDVAALDPAITKGRRFVCSGEVGLWIDDRRIPLNKTELVTTLGAPEEQVARLKERKDNAQSE